MKNENKPSRHLSNVWCSILMMMMFYIYLYISQGGNGPLYTSLFLSPSLIYKIANSKPQAWTCVDMRPSWNGAVVYRDAPRRRRRAIDDRRQHPPSQAVVARHYQQPPYWLNSGWPTTAPCLTDFWDIREELSQ